MFNLIWPECVSSSWMRREWYHWLAPSYPWAKSNCAPMGHYVLCTATDFPGPHWCPDPGLGGDPQGHHQEHAQTLSGLHTHYWFTLWVDKIHTCWISLWFHFFTFIFSLILNPALSGLLILVPTDCCYVILFSINYTIYISKDFQLEQFFLSKIWCV